MSSTTVEVRRRNPAIRVEQPESRFQNDELIDGRYRVVRSIGRGGMGEVAEVVRESDGRIFALKACTVDGAGLRRFAREVRLMERVRHPHVVPVLASNLRSPTPYFLMPLAQCSLSDELPRLVGHEEAAIDVFRQACLGIRAIHGSGIVHRDIKPANILRLRNGRIAVSDLGVAKLETRDTSVLTKTRAIVGTIGYLAPEQFLPEGSRRADIRTDVYQLGKVLYQLLTGHSPVLIEPATLPKGLAHVILRATSVNPDDRYPNLGELLDALRYFELAKDPSRNAREALENLVLEAESLLARNSFRGDNIREILALLTPLDRLDPGAAIERFDRLPDRLLPAMAGEYAQEFLPVLKAFAAALPERVSGFPFGYADHLAQRMRLIFNGSRQPGIKIQALQATLVTAVALNRYAAMDAFNRMLMSITTLDLALPVAEMLRARSREYGVVVHGAPPGRLHPAIRDVQLALFPASDTAF